MKTREKILQAALELYNEHGVYHPHGEGSVTARAIAEKVGISDGNLRYHFPTKEDIVFGLYMALVQELDQGIGKAHHPPINLKSLFQMMIHTYESLYRYRFLMLDFVAIMRRIESISAHFRELSKFRRGQFENIVSQLVRDGIFLPEKLPGQYQVFYEQFQIMSDFWISSAEILYEGEENEKTVHYARMVFSSLVPFLSEKGMVAYRQIIEDH